MHDEARRPARGEGRARGDGQAAAWVEVPERVAAGANPLRRRDGRGAFSGRTPSFPVSCPGAEGAAEQGRRRRAGLAHVEPHGGGPAGVGVVDRLAHRQHLRPRVRRRGASAIRQSRPHTGTQERGNQRHRAAGGARRSPPVALACSALTALLSAAALKWHLTGLGTIGAPPIASGSAWQHTRNGWSGELSMSAEGGTW